jgi:hypothetical protein
LRVEAFSDSWYTIRNVSEEVDILCAMCEKFTGVSIWSRKLVGKAYNNVPVQICESPYPRAFLIDTFSLKRKAIKALH